MVKRTAVSDIHVRKQVEGRNGMNPTTATTENLRGLPLLDARSAFVNNYGFHPSYSSSNPVNPKPKPIIGGKEAVNFYFMHPNQELQLTKQVALTIDLPKHAKTFEAIYVVGHQVSDGVGIIVYVILENDSKTLLRSISRSNFGAGGGTEKIACQLPENSKRIVFVVGKGGQPNQNTDGDQFYLVEPTVQIAEK